MYGDFYGWIAIIIVKLHGDCCEKMAISADKRRFSCTDSDLLGIDIASVPYAGWGSLKIDAIVTGGMVVVEGRWVYLWTSEGLGA